MKKILLLSIMTLSSILSLNGAADDKTGNDVAPLETRIKSYRLEKKIKYYRGSIKRNEIYLNELQAKLEKEQEIKGGPQSYINQLQEYIYRTQKDIRESKASLQKLLREQQASS